MNRIDTGISLDTIWLTTPDFKVHRENSFTIEMSHRVASTGELRHNYDLYIDEYGEIVQGREAFYKDFNRAIDFSIKKYGNTSYLGIRIHRPTTYLGKSNLDLITGDELDNLIRGLPVFLQKHGVRIDADTLFVSSIDINRTFQLEYPLRYYAPILYQLKLTNHNTFRYKSAFYYGKGPKKIKAYDKREQMIDEGHGRPNDIPDNLCRVELTLRTRRRIEPAFNFWQALEFPRSWAKVEAVYQKEIGRLFAANPVQSDMQENPVSAREQLEALTKTLRQKYPNRGIEKRVLLHFAAGQLWKLGLTPELYRELVSSYRNSSLASQKKSAFRELQRDYALACGSVEDVPIAQLYREFRAKALGHSESA